LSEKVGMLKKADADKARKKAQAARPEKTYKHKWRPKFYDSRPLSCRCDPSLPGGEGVCIKCGRAEI